MTAASPRSHPSAPLPTPVRESPVGDSALPRLELLEWRERFGIVAGITTRGLGFNLGLWSEDGVGQVMTRWRAFRTALAPAFPTVILSDQAHGTIVAWHEQGSAGWLILDGVDGHGTARPGTLLTVTVADCIPVYLAVPHKGAVALLHAGWRGTAGGILERGVEVLKRNAFAKAADIVMHCGAGICGGCYEVGSEVARLFPATPGSTLRSLDLRDVLVRQAQELGVGAVSVSPWCTAHDHDRFFSHRASGGREGRMVAYLGRPSG